jgi:CheY-like chemotaxis protein
MEAANGIQALRMLEKGLIPDAIVLDLGLPFMSGWSFLQHLRRDETFDRLPVVILTAHDLTRAQIPGADAVLVKPVPPQDLIDALTDLLDTRH